MSSDNDLQLTLSERRLIEFVRRCDSQRTYTKIPSMILIRMEQNCWYFFELQSRGTAQRDRIDFDKYRKKR